ncbi:hypothetical protein SP15_019 [Bacillus phage SP-15]|uniref:DUF3892 domain-containing protein n=1 Tax=Bacillus phage SP-15 TaxID=1792032 RepID=A0A127AW17_9CAUD|nr:hypothetical protein SP15_019 [Bacillus phage SP-15]AMM44818.1 hypothetical protein SP15_019 [Bacillus phage SP-15]
MQKNPNGRGTSDQDKVNRNLKQSSNKDVEFGTEGVVEATSGDSAGQNESFRGRTIRQLNPVNESSPEFHSKQIVAVRRNGRNISAVQFQDGSSVDVEEAIALAEEGYIEGVNTGTTRGSDGKQKTLRSYPDGDASNNLDNLPSF